MNIETQTELRYEIKINSGKDFQSEMDAIKKLSLQHEASNDTCASVLENLKKLAPLYVHAIVEFTRRDSGTELQRECAKDIYRVSKKIQQLIVRGQTANPKEPTFKNQDPIAPNRDAIKAPTTPYVGSLFNSMFAAFAGHKSFSDYCHWYAKFESISARKEARLEKETLPSRDEKTA